MSVIVKVCGVTTEADAAFCAGVGVDMLGLNFWPSSKRYLEPERARAVAAAARAVNPAMEIVGVFVDPSDADLDAAEQAVRLDWFQLHGDEDASRLSALGPRAFRAVSVASAADIERALASPGELLLLDAPSPGRGGSGTVFDWSLCAPMRESGRRWLLAGGLNPANVGEALMRAKPSGVDVASGVESRPGLKDHERVRAFVRAAKGEL